MDKVKSDGSADDLNMQYGYMEFRHHWNIGSGSKNLGYICKGRPGYCYLYFPCRKSQTVARNISYSARSSLMTVEK